MTSWIYGQKLRVRTLRTQKFSQHYEAVKHNEFHTNLFVTILNNMDDAETRVFHVVVIENLQSQ